MTGTPTKSVTATAIAARAFAWSIPCSAQLSDLRSVMPPLPLLR